MSDAVIIGGGGHARVLLNTLRRRGHVVLGYSAPQPGNALDVPYLGADEQLRALARQKQLIGALGIGKVQASTGRLDLLERIESFGIAFPALPSPGAIVHDDVVLGSATVVLDGAVVVTGTRLGRACIVNTGAIVDHDCMLDDDVHVATGAVVCGGVRIGRHSMIGAGATLKQAITIVAGCTIGAGATVTRDISVPGTYVGTPARKVP